MHFRSCFIVQYSFFIVRRCNQHYLVDSHHDSFTSVPASSGLTDPCGPQIHVDIIILPCIRLLLLLIIDGFIIVIGCYCFHQFMYCAFGSLLREHIPCLWECLQHCFPSYVVGHIIKQSCITIFLMIVVIIPDSISPESGIVIILLLWSTHYNCARHFPPLDPSLWVYTKTRDRRPSINVL
jgi:hypothetical protein